MSTLQGARAAFRFLTILPVGRARPEIPASTTVWFPIAGAAIGVLLLVPAMAIRTSPELGAALTLALWTALTGGLHEDGWADCADAAFAPVPLTRRLEILKDPRVGAHGLSAVVLLFLIRFGALAAGPGPLLLAAPVVGRWTMVLTLRFAPLLRADGLGASFARGARAAPATLVAVAILAGLAMLTGSASLSRAGSLPALLGGALLGLASGTGVAAFLVHRMGGLSGDGHGAAGLAAETGTLVGVALLLRGVSS